MTMAAAPVARTTSLKSSKFHGAKVAPVRSVKAAAVDTGIKAAGKPLAGRKLRVAVIGGGPAGACAAETLAKGGCETFLIERKMDNCKPCGGAIPLCMVGEFDLPEEIIDRKVTKMKMISPSNRAVDVGQTLNDKEYIGMCRREVMDDFLRKRAKSLGTNLVNGLFMKLDDPGVHLVVVVVDGHGTVALAGVVELHEEADRKSVV